MVTHPEFFGDNELEKIWFVGLVGVGVVLQILLTFLNKVVHWFTYYGENLKYFQRTLRYKWSVKIVEWFSIDIVVDFLTIIFYSIAVIIFIKNL